MTGLTRMVKKFRGFLKKAPLADDISSLFKAAYNSICKPVQNRLRGMQDFWMSKKTEEIQSFADRKDLKNFNDALKRV